MSHEGLYLSNTLFINRAMNAWVYIVRCKDGKYYTGSYRGKDIEARVAEHNSGKYQGYTFSRRPVTLVWSQHYQMIKEAVAVERQLKGWSRKKKDALIAGDYDSLTLFAKRRGGKPRQER